MDTQNLIDRAGGVVALAKLLGVNHSTVCGWNREGHIPGNRVRQISRALDLPLPDILALVREPQDGAQA